MRSHTLIFCAPVVMKGNECADVFLKLVLELDQPVTSTFENANVGAKGRLDDQHFEKLIVQN